ncbi:hypothetical protein VKT23_005619 [Stygiomarasmius scandens]|uniref:Uncharacterized protein n=1 Tax=Marasmiellus scandens TaxID=2682957 RepID=A0ABR1JV82_9AGAR
MGWQKTFTLSRRSKGCYLITDEVLSHIEPGIRDVEIGMLFLFIKHTSCALTINENFDRDVRRGADSPATYLSSPASEPCELV